MQWLESGLNSQDMEKNISGLYKQPGATTVKEVNKFWYNVTEVNRNGAFNESRP